MTELHVVCAIKPDPPPRPSVAEQLRALAAEIEGGKHGHAFTLLWAIDCGEGVVTTGLFGDVAEGYEATSAYFLAGIVQRKIEKGIG